MLTDEAKLETVQIKPCIGTRIEASAQTLVSGAHASEIRALLEGRGVLVFPDVGFDDDQQIAFTRTLGTQALEYNGMKVVDGDSTQIFKVSLDPRVNPVGEYFRTSFYWHFDGSMYEVPILASLLSARQVPDEGAATEFCNTYAAYDALPEDEQKQLEGLRVLHANWALQRYINPEPSYNEFARMRDVPTPREQPLVWKHRSGRRSLMIGATAAAVVGMSPTESWDLLVKLRDWATQPQFVYRHEWQTGDLVMWDNTGSLHRAIPYEVESTRLLHRTMLQGEEPVE